MTEPRNARAKTRGKPFQPGNPGKPRGTRSRVSLAVEALLEGEAEKLTRRAIDAALDGDSTALRLCLERIAPVSKERPVTFEMPPVGGPADVPAALAAILASVAAGELAPGEAASIAAIVEKSRAAFELVEIERRIAALEEKAAAA